MGKEISKDFKVNTMSNKDRDHTKCRKLGTSDLCVCCPCGCDTPVDAPNYAELHGAPTEQKEEWEEDFDNLFRVDSFDFSDASYDIKQFIRIEIALAEERGRRETITEFVEWAGKQEWLNKGDLLKFADSLKSNLTQKS